MENRLLRLELMRGQMRELERAFGETQRELSDRVAQLQIEGFALDLATLRYQRTPTEATTP
ncbi:MAG: hypothetical protein ABS36_11085 [Acidobacteria bacterium SCN 69-37]|nr:MAG: hypothetical protein ABS36_11085 [Acidobacteria bacterium SCN 69-37]